MTNTQKQNRRRLIDALRSGQYQQGRGGLRNGQSYCCQGVACDISGLGTWEAHACGDYTYMGLLIQWPPHIRDSLGFDQWTADQFVWMNDGGRLSAPLPMEGYTLEDRCTFDEIADCMELLTLAGL